MSHHAQITLLNRFRRASALRFVMLIAAVLASQNFLVCAFEEMSSAQGTELAATLVEAGGSGDDCCALCLGCTNCGGHCGVAVSARVHDAPSAVSVAFSKIGHDTTAPALWMPSTHLRPPIAAA